MSKVIFKAKGNRSDEFLDMIARRIKRSFETDGFVVVDDDIDVIVIEDEDKRND